MSQLSDDLIRFPEREGAKRSIKTAERSQLQKQIEDFLASGGQVQEHGTTYSAYYPIRRTRAAQINFIKDREHARLRSLGVSKK